MPHLFDRLHGCLLGGAIGDALGLPFERLAPRPRASDFRRSGQRSGNAVVAASRYAFGRHRTRAFHRARVTGIARRRPKVWSRFARRTARLDVLFAARHRQSDASGGPESVDFHAQNRRVFGGQRPGDARADSGRVSARFGSTARVLSRLDAFNAHRSQSRNWRVWRLLWPRIKARAASATVRVCCAICASGAMTATPRANCLNWRAKPFASANNKQTARDFCRDLGLERGVSGYIFHTVPVVLQCWMRYPDDFGAALESIIRCGGDTDSTAAILGGIIGARVGAEALPQHWRSELWDWPNSPAYIEARGARTGKRAQPGRGCCGAAHFAGRAAAAQRVFSAGDSGSCRAARHPEITRCVY